MSVTEKLSFLSPPVVYFSTYLILLSVLPFFIASSNKVVFGFALSLFLGHWSTAIVKTREIRIIEQYNDEARKHPSITDERR